MASRLKITRNGIYHNQKLEVGDLAQDLNGSWKAIESVIGEAQVNFGYGPEPMWSYTVRDATAAEIEQWNKPVEAEEGKEFFDSFFDRLDN